MRAPRWVKRADFVTEPVRCPECRRRLVIRFYVERSLANLMVGLYKVTKRQPNAELPTGAELTQCLTYSRLERDPHAAGVAAPRAAARKRRGGAAKKSRSRRRTGEGRR